MIEMIHKFHSTFQRLIVVESQVENVYELTKQCQRIYEKNIQVDKSKRIVNRIDLQKQRKIKTFDVVVSFFTIFASAFFFDRLFSKANHVYSTHHQIQLFD